MLWGLHRFVPKVPAALVVVLLGVLASIAFDLESRGVEVVGEIPAEFPIPGMPGLGWDAVVNLLPGAIGIVIVVYAETMALGKSFASRHRERVDADQELRAIGVANVMGGLFGGFTSAGSNSRSVAGDKAGQQTQVSSLIVVALLVVTILFLTPLFTNLPEPVLGAIVIYAVIGLIQLGPIARLRTRSRNEFIVAVSTLVAVLVLDILGGLLVGVFISIAQLMQRAVRPRVTPLGLDPDTGSYREVDEEGGVLPVPGMVILRFESELFFANVSILRQRLMGAIDARGIEAVVIDAEAMTEIDTTAADEIADLIEAMDGRGVRYAFARLRRDPRELLLRCGVDVSAHVYRRVADAVDALRTASGSSSEQPPLTVKPHSDRS
jgi:MFS superfamily sulfate permease-like transporter